jgi:hypothetical protein
MRRRGEECEALEETNRRLIEEVAMYKARLMDRDEEVEELKNDVEGWMKVVKKQQGYLDCRDEELRQAKDDVERWQEQLKEFIDEGGLVAGFCGNAHDAERTIMEIGKVETLDMVMKRTFTCGM